jgi:UDPglucose 6-dehydrogenase
MAKQEGIDLQVLRAVEGRNEEQKQVLFEKIQKRFGHDLTGMVFGVWGLAFKPGTDDMREASSVVLLERLIAAGARIKAYDPVATVEARRVMPKDWLENEQVMLVDEQYDALDGTDAIVLVTEWKPFRHPDFERMRILLKNPVIFDGRNQYDPHKLREMGFEYHGIGRPSHAAKTTRE